MASITFDSGGVEVPDDHMLDAWFCIITVTKLTSPGVTKTSTHNWRITFEKDGITRNQMFKAAQLAITAEHPDLADAIVLYFDVQPNRLTR